jgi:fructokinase
MTMFVVVGEALVDLVGQRGGRTFEARPGGSPANVALSLARLGAPVNLITRLGRDAFGKMIIRHLEASGVVVDVGPHPPDATSLAIATLAAGVASYDFRIDWDVDSLPPLPVEAVIDLVRRERERGRVTVSYDPNVRPLLLGERARARAGVEEVVALSDVVKVSDEDLRWLYPDDADEVIARRWLTSGPSLVVVTRGRDGVFATTPSLDLRREAVPIELVDTVGAGDSFTSGLLNGLSRAELIGGERREALRNVDEATLISILDEATVVAGITCSRPGADPPTRDEVNAVLAIRRT